MSAPVLILFARKPVPGATKTRLMPEYDALQAAAVAETLIRETARLARAHWRGPIELSVWPDTGHALFDELCSRYGFALTRQAPGDLGRKMQAALSRWTARGIPAAVMGCDVPHLPPAVLIRANRLLRRRRAVLGPARDGGYYLIGLPRVFPLLFRGMPWGSDALLSKTLRVARSANLRFTLLPAFHDIDTADDLRRVSATLPRLPEA